MKTLICLLLLASGLSATAQTQGFIDERSKPAVAATTSATISATSAVNAVAKAKVEATAPQVPPVQTRWEIRLSDQMLSKALLRWSREAGMPILWGAPNDLVAVSAAYTGDFFFALESVMRDTVKSAYPLHACAYDNVIRVLHRTQSCTN